MDEVENNVATKQETETPETSPNESQPSQEDQTPVENKQDRNWREMRRNYSELERKAKMQEELITQLLVSQKNLTASSAPANDDLDSIADDDYLPKGKVKKLLEKEREVGQKLAREEIEKVFQQKEQSLYAERLRSKFTDFDEVMTPETMDLLEQQDPELAKTILDLKDPYKMALQTYKYIKAYGLAAKVPENRREKEVEKKIEKNSKTIQSPQAYDKRPMAQTFQLTEQLKQSLFEEMNKYSQMADGVPKM